MVLSAYVILSSLLLSQYFVVKGSVLSVSLSHGTEAINGSRVNIHCKTTVGSNYFKWYKSEKMAASVNDVISVCYKQSCPSDKDGRYSFTYSGTDLFVNIPEVKPTDRKFWICANGANSSDFKSIFLHVKVPVTGVSMDIPGMLEVQDDIPSNISCTTSYGRPAADIAFYKEINGNIFEITQNVYKTYNNSGNGETKGTLIYIPSGSDDGAKILCKANNTLSQGPVTAKNNVTIYILEPPAGPPVIQNLTNGSMYTLIENDTLELTCGIRGGKPRPSLTWRCNDGAVVNASYGEETKIKVMWTAKRNKDGSCQCTSYHPAVSTNLSVFVHVGVLYPPSTPIISINGSNRDGTVKVINNTAVPVTCSSSSKPSPTYTWWYKHRNKTGSNITHTINENSTLTCTATNTMMVTSTSHIRESSSYIAFHILYGSTTPDTYCIRDNNYLNINGQTIDVINGSLLSLTCSANGDPQPKYTWNGTEGENINVTITQDNLIYTCVASNVLKPDYGNKTSLSASSAVHVKRLYGPQKQPSIIYRDTDVQTDILLSQFSVVENASFTLTCNNSNGQPSPTYKWTGAGSSLSGVLDVTDIKRSQSINENGISHKYTCIVQNTMLNTCGDRKPQNRILERNVTVNVLYPAVLDPHSNQSAEEGQDVHLTATVTTHGNPMETYKWLYSKTETGSKTALSDSLFHTIQNTSRSQAGWYTIEATNPIHPTGGQGYNKTVSQTFYLDVFYTTTISKFTIGGKLGNVTYSENATNIEVRCHVDSNPSSKMHLNATTYSREAIIAETYSTKRITYTIPVATCFEAGLYSCTGNNNYTSIPASAEARLFVRCTPRPRYQVSQNITVYKALNDSVTLNLTVIAYPEPSQDQFYWEKINGTTTTNMTSGASVNISVVKLESRLTIYSLQQKDFGQYRLMITYNTWSFYSHYFFIHPQDKPQAPTTFTHIQEILSSRTASFQWTPGFNGGQEQTFYVFYKMASDLSWNYVIVSTNKVKLTGLVPGTMYNVKMIASNSLGNSSETVTINFATKEEDGKSFPPIALIGSAAGGGAGLLIIAVVLVVVFYKRTSRPKDSQSDQGRDSLYNDHAIYDENGMEINPAYESADSLGIQQPSTSRDVYAQVDKSRKTQNANVNDNVYAVVDKRKKKKDNDATVQMDVYATPVKGKIGKKGKKGKGGKKKGKCVHEDAEEMNVYSNVGYENEAQQGNIYVNVEETRARKKNVNKDGLLYADIAFEKNNKGQRKLIIHGQENATEYTQIDFTQRADPLPDSDEEDNF